MEQILMNTEMQTNMECAATASLVKRKPLPTGLIVSCQALKHEPLYGGNTIPKMALAAMQGGAVGIRANTVRDINAIWRILNGALPIIGLCKRDYVDSPVYITPTLREVKALIPSKCDVIALDATRRRRPRGVLLKDLVRYIRDHCDKAIMADIADLDDALEAEALGFDYVSSTLRSYTENTRHVKIPDLDFITQLKENIVSATIVAEGGIHTFEEFSSILNLGIDHIIIGGAITRPQNITRSYVDVYDSIVNNK